MEEVKKRLSSEDRKLIHELYFKIYCLVLPRKEIRRLAEEDIASRKHYDRP